MTYGTRAVARQRLWFGADRRVAWVVAASTSGMVQGRGRNPVGRITWRSSRGAFDRRWPATDLYDYTLISEQGYQDIIGWNWHGFEAYRNRRSTRPICQAPASRTNELPDLDCDRLALLAVAIALKPERPRRALLWALLFYPVFATISFGQNTLISLAIFAGVYRLLSSERYLAAGLVAGLLWFKPQLLLGLFVWWAFYPRRYLRCWLGVCVTGLLLAVISWIALPEASQAFVDSLGKNVQFHGEKMWNKHTPKAFFEMLIPGLPTTAYWGLAALVSALSIGVAWWVGRRTGAPVAVMFPVAVFLSLWASPHALIYEWALLIAAGVVLWERFPLNRDVWLCLFAILWVVLAASTPLSLVQEKYLALPGVVQISVPIIGMVGWIAARELVRARASGAQP